MLGFQHSLAVVGGTVIPGILIGNQDPSKSLSGFTSVSPAYLFKAQILSLPSIGGEAGNYLVSYALITSGICTCKSLSCFNASSVVFRIKVHRSASLRRQQGFRSYTLLSTKLINF